MKTAISVDLHVARELRRRRLAAGLSQEQVARALLVSTHQVQKYEGGINRISAGKLFQIAALLDVPIQSFFDLAGSRADPEDGTVPDRSARKLRRVWGHLSTDAQDKLVAFVECLPTPGAPGEQAEEMAAGERRSA